MRWLFAQAHEFSFVKVVTTALLAGGFALLLGLKRMKLPVQRAEVSTGGADMSEFAGR